MNSPPATPPPASISYPKPSAQSTWSLVFGILSICCLWILGSVPAIVLGIIGMQKADRNPAQVGGRGRSLAGLILGICGSVIGIIPIAILMSILVPVTTGVRNKARLAQESSIVNQAVLMCQMYASENEGRFPPTLGDLVPDYLEDPSRLVVSPGAKPLLYRPGLIVGVHDDEPVIASPNDHFGQTVVGTVSGKISHLKGAERDAALEKFPSTLY